MSCGIPVISTRRARHSPIAPPTTTATTSSSSPVVACGCPHRSSTVSHAVASSAIVMPAMP